MLIETIMTTDVVTIHPTESIEIAFIRMERHRIRYLPVVEQESLVGIVTERDLRDAQPPSLNPDHATRILTQPVSSIMTKEVVTAHPRDFIEETALTMYEHNVSCLPVIRQNKVVGIVTMKDVLHTLIELIGVNKPSQRLEIIAPDRPDTLTEVVNILRDFNITIMSVFMFPEKNGNAKHYVFRIAPTYIRHVVQHLIEKNIQVAWPTKDPTDWE